MTKQSNQTNPRGFRTLAALLPFLRPYKKQFVLAIFSLILAASATLAVPLSCRQIIDLGFNANSDNQINQTFLILFMFFNPLNRVRLEEKDKFSEVLTSSIN